jgi:hypothetical protein
MRRRELLAALPGLALMPTLTVDGKANKALAYLPKGHYMVFADVRAVDLEGLMNTPSPEGITMDLIPVRLGQDQTIHDVVAIYKTDREPTIGEVTDSAAQAEDRALLGH